VALGLAARFLCDGPLHRRAGLGGRILIQWVIGGLSFSRLAAGRFVRARGRRRLPLRVTVFALFIVALVFLLRFFRAFRLAASPDLSRQGNVFDRSREVWQTGHGASVQGDNQRLPRKDDAELDQLWPADAGRSRREDDDCGLARAIPKRVRLSTEKDRRIPRRSQRRRMA